MRDRLAVKNSEEERLKIIYYSRRGTTRGEITLQLRSTNQRKWLAVETPEERGLRLEC